MSNPLAVFRKYQKILLVVFGVLLMLTFTVGGIVSQYLSSSAAATNNPVVVEMNSGDFRESDLHHLRVARHYLRQFMRYVNMTAAQAGATPRQTLGIPDTNNEANLLQTAILAERAKKAGMEITDQAILNFLDRYTQSTIPHGDYPALLRDATRAQMAPNQFFNAMRRELLALRYVGLFECGMLAPTPETAWDFYQRLNRRVSFEAVPVSVSDFLAQVPEPSASEIKAVYEEGKDRDPVPSSPEPGFKQMKQVAIQYVKGDLSQFLPAAESQITQEQIEEFYNANKEEYRNLDFPMQGDEFSVPTDTSPTDTSPTDDSTSETPATEDAESTASPTTDESEANAENPENGDDAAPESNDQSQRFSPTETLLTGQTEDAAEATDAATDDVSDAVAEVAEETVDADSDISEADAETIESDSPVAETTETVEEEPVADEGEATTVVEETTEEPVAETDAAADADAALSELLNDTSDDEDPLAGLTDAPGSSKPEFKPLAEVEDEIRMRLASPIARTAMNDALNAVRSEMKSFLSEYRGWYLSADRDNTEAPSPPDLRPLAQELGLTFNSVPLVNMYELLQSDPTTGEPVYEISRAYATAPVFQGFYQIAFKDELRLFQPETIRGQVVDTEYLFWKVDEKEERVPELDEVRDEVVRAAKHAKALELAKKSADELAESLRASGQRPSDVYRNDPNRKVIVSPSMSWMTANVPGAPPRLTPVPGIQYAGQDFMKSVFSLDTNQYGTAVDQPQKNVYAVMVTSVDTQDEELRTQFVKSFATSPANETLYLVRQDAQQHVRDWYQSIEDELDVKWVRDPAVSTAR